MNSDHLGEVLSLMDAFHSFSFSIAASVADVPSAELSDILNACVEEGILECFTNEFGHAVFERSVNYLEDLPLMS